jgi:activating signal cointegrator complex subunit 1
MTSSDKRRGGANSATHTIRSTATSRSSSSSIIAPPPRAQLGNPTSTSSAPPPDADDAGSIKEREGSIKEREGSIKEKDTASTAALLKEKDEKINELKRELVEIESEFARQVERLSQNESETAAFWQAKHSALNQQFLRTDTELRLLRAEIDVRAGENEELKEGWDFLKREIKARDDEIRRLRTDLMSLKKWLSTSTRTDEQESDDLFAGDMARLGNGLQEWAIQHFRKAKIGKSTVSKVVNISDILIGSATNPGVSILTSK